MRKRTELADYFEPDYKGDIFDFIPPQRTNQIFTPKKVVKDMVDRLEQENPGCFDVFILTILLPKEYTVFGEEDDTIATHDISWIREHY